MRTLLNSRKRQSKPKKSPQQRTLGFFNSPWRQTVIDTIRNLVLLDQPLVIVTGSRGAGKTCICHYLANCFVEQSERFLLLTLQPQHAAEGEGGVFESLMRQLDRIEQKAPSHRAQLTGSVTVEQVTQALQQFSARQASDHSAIRILVDNAQYLSVKEVSQLLALIEAMALNSVQFVLFSEKHLIDAFMLEPVKDLFQAYGERVDVPPFNLKETQQFIEFFFVQKGLPVPHWPVDKIKRIQYKTFGLPGNIMQWLEGHHSRPMTPWRGAWAHLWATRQRSWVLASGAVVLVAAVMATLFFGPTQPSPESLSSSSEQMSITEQRDTAEQVLEKQAEQGVVFEFESTDSSLAVVKNLPEDEPGNPEKNLVQVQDEAIAEIKDVLAKAEVEPKPEAPILEAPIPILEKPKSEELKQMPNAWKEQLAKAQQEGAHIEQIALLKQNPQHYTLQIMGGRNETKIKAFIEQQGELASLMHYFPTVHQGKPWYVVIYGDFLNQSEAQQAARALKGDLTQARPWVRQFAHIQRQLENTPFNGE